MADAKPNAKLPDPVAVKMCPSSYQPTKAEMEEEFDTPAWTEEQLRQVFMRPFVAKDSDRGAGERRDG